MIHAFIDPEDYVHLKSTTENVSELVRRLIKGYLSIEVQETDKDKLLKEIVDKQSKITQLRDDLSLLYIQVEKIEDEEEKELAEKDLKNKQIVKGIKASGIMRDLL